LELLANRPVAEVTGDSAAAPPPADIPILVGTEAVLHRVAGAAAVAFLDFDQELLAPRYRAAEAALGLLARAARLVGGRSTGGGRRRRCGRARPGPLAAPGPGPRRALQRPGRRPPPPRPAPGGSGSPPRLTFDQGFRPPTGGTCGPYAFPT